MDTMQKDGAVRSGRNLRPGVIAAGWLAGAIAFVGCSLLMSGGPLETDDVVGAAIFSAIATGAIGLSGLLRSKSVPQRLLMLLAGSLAAGAIAATIMVLIGEHAVDVPSARLVGLGIFAVGVAVHSAIMYRRA